MKDGNMKGSLLLNVNLYKRTFNLTKGIKSKYLENASLLPFEVFKL